MRAPLLLAALVAVALPPPSSAAEAQQLPRGQTVLSSALRAAGTDSSQLQVPPMARGAAFHVNVTAEGGTATLDVKVQRRDPTSGVWHDIAGASLAQITATGHYVLIIAPGITAAANLRVADVLGATIRVFQVLAGSSTPTFTYSLGVVWQP